MEYVQNGRFAALGSCGSLVSRLSGAARVLVVLALSFSWLVWRSCGRLSCRSRSWFVLVPLSWLVALVCGALVVLVALSCGARSHAALVALVALVWLVARAARGSRLSPSSALVWLVWCRSCSFVVRGRRSCSLFALALVWISQRRVPLSLSALVVLVARVDLPTARAALARGARSWSARVALSWLVVARS